MDKETVKDLEYRANILQAQAKAGGKGSGYLKGRGHGILQALEALGLKEA